MRKIRIAAACLMIALACGCGASPAAPSLASATTLAGVWVGAIDDRAFGPGTARIEATQSNGVATGSFALMFPDSSQNRTGSFSGYLTGPSVTAFLTPDDSPPCPGGPTLSETLEIIGTVSGMNLTGTYVGFGCGTVLRGTLDLERQ